jgi:regulatory protein
MVTAQQALRRLQQLCSKSERCVSDVQKKLAAWHVAPEAWPTLVAQLQQQGFIDEDRYARAFVRDKHRLAHWGAMKIRQALQAKKIPAAAITAAMQEIDADTYQEELTRLLARKNASFKAGMSPADRKLKLLRFALSRGYEYELAKRIID